jgi:hypothetical protein
MILLPTEPASTVSPLAIAGLQAVGTIVGAAIGGGLTWFTATKKIRGERAFDRRLEWHERTHASLAKALDNIEDACFKLENNPKYPIHSAFDAMSDALSTLRIDRVNAQLYAGPQVISMVADLRASIIEDLERLTDDRAPTRDEAIAAFQRIANLLVESMLAVAAEGRRHLGVERLSKDELKVAARVKTPVERKGSPAAHEGK